MPIRSGGGRILIGIDNILLIATTTIFHKDKNLFNINYKNLFFFKFATHFNFFLR
jgi:hypothetical protein